MKTIMILLVTASRYITGCTQNNMSDMFTNDAHRGEMFSEILKNDQWSSELIDSLMMKHHGEMMTKMNDMMKGDQRMQMGMMDSMMSMCNADSSMCKMMMSSMQSRPNVMKSMQSMSDMNEMKMPMKK